MPDISEPPKGTPPPHPPGPAPHVAHRWNKIAVVGGTFGAGAAVVATIFGVLAYLNSPAPPSTTVSLQLPPPREAADPNTPVLLRFNPPVQPGMTVTWTMTSSVKQGEPEPSRGDPTYTNSGFDFTVVLRSPQGEEPAIGYVEKWRQRGADGKEDHSIEGATIKRSATAFKVFTLALDKASPAAMAFVETLFSPKTGGAYSASDVFDPGVPVLKGSTWSARPDAVAQFFGPMAAHGDVDAEKSHADYTITALDSRTATFRGTMTLVMKSILVNEVRVPAKNMVYTFEIGGDVSTASSDWTGFSVTMSNTMLVPLEANGMMTALSSEVHVAMSVRPGGNIPTLAVGR